MEHSLKIQKEITALERFFSHHSREIVEELAFGFSVFFLSFSVVFALPVMSSFAMLWPVAQGLFLISFSVLLMTILLEVYFQSLHIRLRRAGMSLAVSLITDRMRKRKDSVTSLFDFVWSKDIKKRLGIAEEQLSYFLSQKVPRIIHANPEHQLHSFGHHLYQEDIDFQNFLDGIMVDKDHFVEVLKIVEDGMHYRLQSRVFLSPVFHGISSREYSFQDIVREDIEDLEYLYDVHFTEKAIQDVSSHFQKDQLTYISSVSRKDFVSALIEDTLRSHQELSHGRRAILPSDTRRFIIAHKAGII